MSKSDGSNPWQQSRPFLKLTVAVAIGIRLVLSPAVAANPDVLWSLVRAVTPQTCVASCLMVDVPEHFAVLKDLVGVAQVLLIPTDKITGVEDPALLAPQTPNFFGDAWTHRDLMLAKLPQPVPRDAISLAVNATTARSQNQLHIHIDCLSAAARDALIAAAPSVGRTWAPLTTPVVGHLFLARRVEGEDLGDFNPFRAVAETLADPAHDMALQNVVVVGARFPTDTGTTTDGFLVLTDRAPSVPLGYGGGEDVQDHACALAKAGQ
jgi:CDP-diacylglycerol pyrophosphatase